MGNLATSRTLLKNIAGWTTDAPLSFCVSIWDGFRRSGGGSDIAFCVESALGAEKPQKQQ